MRTTERERKGLAAMSQDNQITLRGYLTQEPKLYQRTAEAIPLTEIRVGSTPRRLNRETGEWQEAPASYYTVKCWRRLAINAASSLHKGDTVIIRGRFYTNTWVDSQQQTRTTLEIEADSLGHDLAYGWSHFLRGVRQQPRDNAGGDGGEMVRQDTGLTGEVNGREYPGGFGADTADAAEASGLSEAAETFAAANGDGGLGDLEGGLVASEAGLPDSFAGLPEPEAVPF
jgi:single-strand DNA-binding protein